MPVVICGICNSRGLIGFLLFIAWCLMAFGGCSPDGPSGYGIGQTAAGPGREAGQTGTATPTVVLLAPTPTPSDLLFKIDYFPTVYVSPSLEEQVFDSEVIVRASLMSAAADTEPVPSDPGVAPTYRPVEVLTFQVHEYLKGSGPGEVEVRVRGNLTYLTEAEALAVAGEVLAERNTSWDDREAVLFLNPGIPWYLAPSRSSGQQRQGTTDQFSFTLSNFGAQPEFEYSVDTLSRAWLPAGDAGNARDTRSNGNSGGQVYITDGQRSPPTQASLEELRTIISDIETELRDNAHIDGYTSCVRARIRFERSDRAAEFLSGQPTTQRTREVSVPSNSPGGLEIYGRDNNNGETKYHRYLLFGPDAEYFQALVVDADTDPSNGYRHVLATVRPMPAGVCKVVHLSQIFQYIPCDFVKPESHGVEYTVTVEAPPLDTVHEAFFDPVADGAAVGYTAGAGRLEPAAFDFDGTGVKITDLRWEEGSVSLTVDPPGGLTDFALEFIALDGTTSRRLSGSAATEDAGTGTITCQVSAPIWEDGDLVLLRISEGGGDPSPAPIEEPTATPRSPTPTSASYPDPGAGNGSNAWHVPAGPSESDQKGIRSIY